MERGALLALLTVGYAACALLSILLFEFGDGQAGIWLPNVLAVVLLLRNRSMPLVPSLALVFVGCSVANLLLDRTLANTLFFASANTASVLVEFVLLRKALRGGRAVVSGARDYALMLFAGGVAGPGLAAAVFAPIAAQAFGWPLLPGLVGWVVGEGLGYAVMLPILLMANHAALQDLLGRLPLLRTVAAAGGAVLLAVAASNWTQSPFILVIVPLMVAASLAAPFELALACGATGVALIGLEVTGAFELEPSSGYAYGFRLSVAVVTVLPFIAGLVMEQWRRDSRRIAESEQRFRRAMEDSAIGVAVVGLDGHIAEANRAFADMLGYSREELQTMTFFQITHPEDVAIGSETMRRVRGGEATTYQFEKRYLRKDGRPLWARLSGSVIRDTQTGAPIYLVSQIEDIDSRKQAEAAVAAAEKRWDFALASAGQGRWDLDTRKGRVTYSSTWKKMLGYDEDQLDGDVDLWLTLVHPDDRARVEQADRDHVAGKTPMFEAEFRMRHRQGHWVWILDRGMIVERDAEGRMARAIGTLTDITVRKQSEERIVLTAALLDDERERLRVTLDSIGDAVICTDAAMLVTFMNPVAERLTGVDEREALGRSIEEVYAPTDEETGDKIATAATLSGLKERLEHNNRAILSKEDGSRCYIREVVSPILNDRNEFCGAVIVFQDFTDARALQRRLVHAAAHDSLTGLANRATLLTTMSALLSRRQDERSDDLLLFVDLDNFKAVNDTGGHAAGDVLLKRVADVIRDTTRTGDIAARLGGDEFAVILKDCDIATGAAIAERLIAAIRRLSTASGVSLGQIGASVGLTVIGREETDVDAVIVRADLACYQAKARGRGQVCVLTEREAAAGRKALARAS